MKNKNPTLARRASLLVLLFVLISSAASVADPVSTPSPASLGDSLIKFEFLVGLALNVITIWALMRNRKEQREISWAFEPASRKEFDLQKDHCTARHSQIFRRLDDEKKESAEQLRLKARDLELKIDQNQKQIAETLRTMPNEIVALLRNTGVIK